MNPYEIIGFGNSTNDGLKQSQTLSRLYLSAIIKNNMLNRRDIRSIKKWCKKYDVEIYKDLTGEFVFKPQFDLAYNLPLITNLKSQYGNDWKVYYSYYLNNELYQMVGLKKSVEAKKDRYTPQGRISQKIKR